MTSKVSMYNYFKILPREGRKRREDRQRRESKYHSFELVDAFCS